MLDTGAGQPTPCTRAAFVEGCAALRVIDNPVSNGSFSCGACRCLKAALVRNTCRSFPSS